MWIFQTVIILVVIGIRHVLSCRVFELFIKHERQCRKGSKRCQCSGTSLVDSPKAFGPHDLNKGIQAILVKCTCTGLHLHAFVDHINGDIDDTAMVSANMPLEK